MIKLGRPIQQYTNLTDLEILSYNLINPTEYISFANNTIIENIRQKNR